MREVQASQAKTHFLQLLDDVERGETVVITRHGRPVARLTSEARPDQNKVAEAFAALKEFRRSNGRITVEEILSARDEGRKY
ncbi:type II toxin-antitoxin system Phd/YefM family antitoxin [Paracidobacterium acidisoli]|uniref:Antitoxin n=1 Tax=Paracidobacterium acidisoli TaxID=2303751 RepID=A0A372IPE6_9BACT|nr:type II toxin-antitoxin system prevent-host-death family antitoxin [Paracidobacterium acidisoli]MBT9331141.1 type II toxin-antitoxin system prevent-host-death family antitoxin [Paracidobacterium acidisoli]